MTRTAIIAAFPGELKPLVHGWPHGTRNGVDFWAQRDVEDEWIAACAGAGQAAATRAFAALEDGGPIDLVFSIGWAGALRGGIAPGSAHNIAGVIDVRTGDELQARFDIALTISPVRGFLACASPFPTRTSVWGATCRRSGVKYAVSDSRTFARHFASPIVLIRIS